MSRKSLRLNVSTTGDLVLYLRLFFSRSIRPDLFCKGCVQKVSQNSQEKTCARVSFLIKLQASTCNFIKKETLVQVFSCGFCEIFKNIFFYRTLRWLLLLFFKIYRNLYIKAQQNRSSSHEGCSGNF